MPITERPGWQLTGSEFIAGVLTAAFMVWFLGWLWEIVKIVFAWIWNVITWPFRMVWHGIVWIWNFFEGSYTWVSNVVGWSHQPAWYEVLIFIFALAMLIIFVAAYVSVKTEK